MSGVISALCFLACIYAAICLTPVTALILWVAGVAFGIEHIVGEGK